MDKGVCMGGGGTSETRGVGGDGGGDDEIFRAADGVGDELTGRAGALVARSDVCHIGRTNKVPNPIYERRLQRTHMCNVNRGLWHTQVAHIRVALTRNTHTHTLHIK
jgi:hypothetical protein